MGKEKDVFKKIVFYGNSFFYSWKFLVILAIFIYLLYKFVENNIFILAFIYIFILIFWFIKLIYIPKNRSEKYGIVFLLNNGDAYDENIDSMFKKLKFMLEDDFKILVFNNNFLKNIKKQKKKEKVLFKKKYHMVINLYSFKAKENSENICSLTNKDITFISPKLDVETQENLNKDFNNAFKKIMKLSEKNSYNDITENVDLMSLSIRYFVSIIYIIFNNLEKAEEELNKMNFDNLPPSDKIVQYLRKNFVMRFADIYFIRMMKIIYEKEYLYDENKFKVLCHEEQKLSNLIGTINDNISDIKYFNNDIKAKIFFVQGNYNEAIFCLNQMIKKNQSDYAPKLSKAFIEVYSKNYKGIELYKKLSKRKDINLLVIDECINFIDNALKNNKFDSTMLLLCKGLLIYYWHSKPDGEIIISTVITKIEDVEFKEYLTVRYENNKRKDSKND